MPRPPWSRSLLSVHFLELIANPGEFLLRHQPFGDGTRKVHELPPLQGRADCGGKSHGNPMRALVGRPLLLLPEGLPVEGAGWSRDASEKRESDKHGYDDLHGSSP